MNIPTLEEISVADTVRIETLESLGMVATIELAKSRVPSGYKFHSVREICDIARQANMWTEEQLVIDPRMMWEENQELKRKIGK